MNDAQVFGFEGILLPSVRLYGRQVDVVFRLHGAEIDRRSSAGIEALLDRDLMEALASLPHGSAVPWDSIDPVIHPLLDQAPEVLLHKNATHVERLYVPPLWIVGVVKRTRTWMQGLEAISLFAPHAPRGLVVMGDESLDETLSKAQRIGVGIAHKARGAQTKLLTRPSARYVRSGSTQWLFSEAVYGQWLDRYKQSAQAFS